MNQALCRIPKKVLYHLCLSPREKEILVLISLELTTNEIARKLFLSHETIKSHRRNLFLKFGAKNVAGLITSGFRYGHLKL